MGPPSHPAWVRWAPAAAAARKQRAKDAGPASSSARQRAAASGRRSRKTGKASAHAAQYAAGATRSAHWSPSPPRRAGKSARRAMSLTDSRKCQLITVARVGVPIRGIIISQPDAGAPRAATAAAVEGRAASPRRACKRSCGCCRGPRAEAACPARTPNARRCCRHSRSGGRALQSAGLAGRRADMLAGEAYLPAGAAWPSSGQQMCRARQDSQLGGAAAGCTTSSSRAGPRGEVLWNRERIRLHEGKTRIWNAAGEEPPRTAVLAAGSGDRV